MTFVDPGAIRRDAMQGRRERSYAGIWTRPRTQQRAAERSRATQLFIVGGLLGQVEDERAEQRCDDDRGADGRHAKRPAAVHGA